MPILSIVLLLKQPRALAADQVNRAVAAAYRDAPEPARVVQSKAGMFGVLLGPMRLGVISVPKPYFAEPVAIANQTNNFLFREAVLHHRAWISVDLMGDAPPEAREAIYDMIGLLIAELLGDDVLGLIKLPDGPGIGYDFSFIPMLRNRQVDEVFTKGPPDRITKTKPDQAEALAAATAEAKRRFAEFRHAYEHRRPEQKFGVKSCFEAGDRRERMWVSIEKLDGSKIVGQLANDPQILKNLMELGETVRIDVADVEDWIYTDGKATIGGFQAAVLRRNA